MRYPETVDFLYALGNEYKSFKLGLESITRLLAALGDPHRAFRVVHVAGTNGKGSTCAMIESALRASGIRTGLFTSPHLIEPTERIQINGEPVSREDFTRAFDIVHQAAEKLVRDGDLPAHPTYFETVTAMGFVLFRDRKVETAVVEVGLGGRLDATNVVDPMLCVITPIDYDHEQWLGNSIEAIAGEKAGIIKPGVPVVLAAQRPEADAVLRAKASELGSPILDAAGLPISNVIADAQGTTFEVAPRGTAYHVPNESIQDAPAPELSGHGGLSPSLPPHTEIPNPRLRIPLPGEHQLTNAATAITALRALQIPDKSIAEGLVATKWPGRLEVISEDPEILLDGAHNPAGARALAAHLKRFYSDRRKWIIYGAMRDKSLDEIIESLFPLFDRVILTAPDNPRAARPEALASQWPHTHVTANVAEAIDLARREAAPEDVVVITGSLFVVGEARAILLRPSPVK